MTGKNSLNGVLAVEKPIGPTSHDIVKLCRNTLGRGTKVGHAGTLDPFASGVLIVLVGQATRLSRYFQASDKEYIALVRLGMSTDTYDKEGEIVSKRPVPPAAERDIPSVLKRFTGPIMQIPPMHSAIKINGRKLYHLARNKETIERPPRRVIIHHLQLLEESADSVKLKVACSSGTYIRSLAHDLGQELGCGAHLESLTRTRSGAFSLQHTHSLKNIQEAPEGCLVPMIDLLPEIAAAQIDEEESALIRNGRPIPSRDMPAETEIRLCHESELVAISRSDGRLLHPRIVFNYR